MRALSAPDADKRTKGRAGEQRAPTRAERDNCELEALPGRAHPAQEEDARLGVLRPCGRQPSLPTDRADKACGKCLPCRRKLRLWRMPSRHAKAHARGKAYVCMCSLMRLRRRAPRGSSGMAFRNFSAALRHLSGASVDVVLFGAALPSPTGPACASPPVRSDQQLSATGLCCVNRWIDWRSSDRARANARVSQPPGAHAWLGHLPAPPPAMRSSARPLAPRRACRPGAKCPGIATAPIVPLAFPKSPQGGMDQSSSRQCSIGTQY